MKEYVKMGLTAIMIVVLLGIYFKDDVVNVVAPGVEALGSQYDIPARLDVATTTTVGPDALPRTRIFTKNGECDARVITTRGDSAIMISFGEDPLGLVGNISSTTLSGSIGHLQLASTTVVYDAEMYGCSDWYAYAFATSTITVSGF